jgi:hypothetical protein
MNLSRKTISCVFLKAVQADDVYFTWRKDTVGKPGASGRTWLPGDYAPGLRGT